MRPMIAVRTCTGDDRENANAFYARCGSGAVIYPGATALLAEDDDGVVGIVQLCPEYGHLVLRAMMVRDEYRGRGIGTRMLIALRDLMRGQDCYCLPYTHLATFYGSAGFAQIGVDEAPPHLQQRLREYLARGLDVIVMKRAKPQA